MSSRHAEMVAALVVVVSPSSAAEENPVYQPSSVARFHGMIDS